MKKTGHKIIFPRLFSGKSLPGGAGLKNIFRFISIKNEQNFSLSKKPGRLWRLAQVEPSIKCNFDCLMCPWKKIRKDAGRRGNMNDEIWEAIRPYLPEIASLDFTGGGEPLLNPKLEKWIAGANLSGCETGFLTNGSLLDKKASQRMIKAGVDWIAVSMDGATKEVYEKIRRGSDFELLLKNLENLVSQKKDGAPFVMINFVMMPLNFNQAEDIIRLASEIGADQVNFKQCDVSRGEHGRGFALFGPDETGKAERFKKNMRKTLRLAEKLGVIATDFPFGPKELPVCAQDPRDSIFISFEGFASPCINLAYGGATEFLGEKAVMPTARYGRLPEQNFCDLRQSSLFRLYRNIFQKRVAESNKTILEKFLDAFFPGRKAGLKDTEKYSLNAPDGCHSCHYLFNV